MAAASDEGDDARANDAPAPGFGNGDAINALYRRLSPGVVFVQ